MTGGAFDAFIVELHAVVETVWAVRLIEVEIFVAEPGVAHGDRVVIGKIGADVFDRDVMRNTPVVAFGTVHGVVIAIDAQMHRCILGTAPAVGAKYGHVDPHGAIMAGEAEQADGAWGVYFVFEGAAIVEVVAMLGRRHKTVPSLNAAKRGGVGAFLFRWDMTVDA